MSNQITENQPIDLYGHYWGEFFNSWADSVPTFFTETVSPSFQATAEWINEYIQPFFNDSRIWFEGNANWLWPVATLIIASAALITAFVIRCLFSKKPDAKNDSQKPITIDNHPESVVHKISDIITSANCEDVENQPQNHGNNREILTLHIGQQRQNNSDKVGENLISDDANRTPLRKRRISESLPESPTSARSLKYFVQSSSERGSLSTDRAKQGTSEELKSVTNHLLKTEGDEAYTSKLLFELLPDVVKISDFNVETSKTDDVPKDKQT